MSLLYPVSLDHLLSGYACDRNHIGRSPSEVFRLELEGSPTLYLKREAHGPFSELSDEAARLRWLYSLGLPCPAVVAHVVEDGHDWLVTSALPGRDLACETALPPFERVVLLALALRRLHSVDIACCPFDHGWQKRLAVAERRMRAGLIDEGDFDVERLGQSAAGLFCELGELTVTDEDLVVTHGDACLPNFIALDGAFSGYIDCGRLGVADRYQDIALACRSIEKNFGAVFVQPFCDHYGSGLLDTRKMKRYQLLDEFF